MSTNTPSADVCTPKRPRRTAAPKLPYPDALDGTADPVAFWTNHVARSEAELEAFDDFYKETFSKLPTEEFSGPLASALLQAHGLLTHQLNRDKENLSRAIKLAEVPA